jgi:hypothetical protein
VATETAIGAAMAGRPEGAPLCKLATTVAAAGAAEALAACQAAAGRLGAAAVDIVLLPAGPGWVEAAAAMVTAGGAGQPSRICNYALIRSRRCNENFTGLAQIARPGPTL